MGNVSIQGRGDLQSKGGKDVTQMKTELELGGCLDLKGILMLHGLK